MIKRKPLDLLQKWLVTQYWIRQNPTITRCALAVLMRLLDRQNPKTGRCDPSAVGLSEETGFTERSVRAAFKELEARGALKRYRASRRARNQFLIFSVEELGQNDRLRELKCRAGQRTGMKPISAPPAPGFRSNVMRPSPETIKETKKKKEFAERRSAAGLMEGQMSQGGEHGEIGFAEFEKRAVKVFERHGYGYEGLMELSLCSIEEAHDQLLRGKTNFSGAVGELLRQYREAKDIP